MRSIPADFSYGDPGPEEIALEGWVEDSGPYMSLSEAAPDGADEPDED